MQRTFQAAIAFIAGFIAGCADPLWEREGRCLNPWGGDFLGLRSAWKRVQIKRIQEDWGVGKWQRLNRTGREGDPPMTFTLP
jgi:hypothetical protein